MLVPIDAGALPQWVTRLALLHAREPPIWAVTRAERARHGGCRAGRSVSVSQPVFGLLRRSATAAMTAAGIALADEPRPMVLAPDTVRPWPGIATLDLLLADRDAYRDGTPHQGRYGAVADLSSPLPRPQVPHSRGQGDKNAAAALARAGLGQPGLLAGPVTIPRSTPSNCSNLRRSL
jgi:hypothetical protein